MAKRSSAETQTPQITDAMIAEHAYYKAEQRGFAPGHELADWLEAKAEVEALLRKAVKASKSKKPAAKAAPKPAEDKPPKRKSKAPRAKATVKAKK